MFLQGFAHPTKTERRFFATRLREMITEKILEKVQVPHPMRKNGTVTCIRLLSHPEAEDTAAPDGNKTCLCFMDHVADKLKHKMYRTTPSNLWNQVQAG